MATTKTRTVNNERKAKKLPFWPGGQSKLELQYPDGNDPAELVTVVCVDPANHNKVFETTIRRGQLNALADAMEKGAYTVSNDNKSTDVLIISEPGPRTRIVLPAGG